MSSPEQGTGARRGGIRSALARRSSRCRPPERLLVVVAALVQPLFQIQLPAYVAVPVLVVAAATALWR